MIKRLDSVGNDLADYAHDSVVDKVTNSHLMSMTSKYKKNVIFNNKNIAQTSFKLTHLESNPESIGSKISQSVKSQKFTAYDKESL